MLSYIPLPPFRRCPLPNVFTSCTWTLFCISYPPTRPLGCSLYPVMSLFRIYVCCGLFFFFFFYTLADLKLIAIAHGVVVNERSSTLTVSFTAILVEGGTLVVDSETHHIRFNRKASVLATEHGISRGLGRALVEWWVITRKSLCLAQRRKRKLPTKGRPETSERQAVNSEGHATEKWIAMGNLSHTTGQPVGGDWFYPCQSTVT